MNRTESCYQPIDRHVTFTPNVPTGYVNKRGIAKVKPVRCDMVKRDADGNVIATMSRRTYKRQRLAAKILRKRTRRELRREAMAV